MQTKETPMDESEAPPARKPLVHYSQLLRCQLGESAFLVPCDHPSLMVSNRGVIITSTVVVAPDGSGGFETLNTRYEPLPKLSD